MAKQDIENINVEEIREKVQMQEIIKERDLKQLEELQNKTTIDNISLAILFIKCFDHLSNNYERLSEEKIKRYLETFDVNILRATLKGYDYGNNLGDRHREKDIDLLINKERDKYSGLINLFFRIFGEDI